jgi:hypothetical protein
MYCLTIPTQRRIACSAAIAANGAAMNYEDNFGYYDLNADPDEPAFFTFVKSQSKPTNCLRCREAIRLLPGRDTCARCCGAMEYGADQEYPIPPNG